MTAHEREASLSLSLFPFYTYLATPRTHVSRLFKRAMVTNVIRTGLTGIVAAVAPPSVGDWPLSGVPGEHGKKAGKRDKRCLGAEKERERRSEKERERQRISGEAVSRADDIRLVL